MIRSEIGQLTRRRRYLFYINFEIGKSRIDTEKEISLFTVFRAQNIKYNPDQLLNYASVYLKRQLEI